jgi:AraC-like DNA-binding protein
MPADYDVSPMALIPERPWHCLVDQIALREDIPDLGLHIGNEMPFGDISSMSFMFRSCSTLQELLSTFCLQAERQSSTRRFDFVAGPAGVWLRDTGTSLLGNRQSDVQIRLYILLGMIQVVQLALGKSWRPRAIELPFKHHKAIEQSGYLGAENIYFDSAFSAIELPLDVVADKLGYSDYSKFSRAFQRWFLETPKQARLRYRRRE